MRCLWSAILAVVALRGETLDRIAVTVGKQVIAESQIVDEIRVSAFLEGATPDLSGPNKRKVADRLVERVLIERELAVARYPAPEAGDSHAMLDQMKARWNGEAAFETALSAAGITAAQLEQQLQLQLQVLRFIDYRFRPGIQVSDDDIREMYDKQVEEWKAKHTEPPPTLEASRSEILSVLTRERADQALDRWLGETRTREQIVYREAVFK